MMIAFGLIVFVVGIVITFAIIWRDIRLYKEEDKDEPQCRGEQ